MSQPTEETQLMESIQQEVQSIQEEMKKLVQTQLQDQIHLTSDLRSDLQQLQHFAQEMQSTSTIPTPLESENIYLQISKLKHEVSLLDVKLYQESHTRVLLENQLNDSHSKNATVVKERDALLVEENSMTHQLSSLQTQLKQTTSQHQTLLSENRQLKEEMKELKLKQDQSLQEMQHSHELQLHSLQQKQETEMQMVKREMDKLREENKSKTNQLQLLKSDYEQDIKCIQYFKEQMDLMKQSYLETRLEMSKYKREVEKLKSQMK